MLILENGTVRSHRASAGDLHSVEIVRNRHHAGLCPHGASTARARARAQPVLTDAAHSEGPHKSGRQDQREQLNSSAARKISMESLILAQDERWRRA